MGGIELSHDGDDTNLLGLKVGLNLNVSSYIDKIPLRLCFGVLIIRRLSSFSNLNILTYAYYGCPLPNL